MADREIDTSDSPPLDDSFFDRATLRPPRTAVRVTVPVDPDVLAWYREQGGAWERRMATALRIYAEAHKTESA